MTITIGLGLPVFPHRHYGADICPLPEDGDWVGHGHITPRTFIAACNRQYRTTENRSLLAGMYWPSRDMKPTYSDLLAEVRHTWAVRLPKCTCDPEVVVQVGCDDHDTSPDPDDWWISWSNIAPDTPGAFPITLGLWS